MQGANRINVDLYQRAIEIYNQRIPVLEGLTVDEIYQALSEDSEKQGSSEYEDPEEPAVYPEALRRPSPWTSFSRTLDEAFQVPPEPEYEDFEDVHGQRSTKLGQFIQLTVCIFATVIIRWINQVFDFPVPLLGTVVDGIWLLSLVGYLLLFLIGAAQNKMAVLVSLIGVLLLNGVNTTVAPHPPSPTQPNPNGTHLSPPPGQ